MYELIAFCKWCQDLPHDELAKTIKELGFDGVDLPCRPNAPITHERAPEELPRLKAVLEDHGLKLSRLVTGIQEADAVTERLLETARQLGIEKVRLAGYSLKGGADPRQRLDEARRSLEALEPLFEKHGVRGAVQNHSGVTLDVNISSVLRVLEGRNPEWLGVQYDPGHTTISGEPIPLALGLMGPYLHSVNLKSPRQEYCADRKTGRLTFKPIWVPLPDGMLDVPAVLKAVQEAGYTDPISIHAEYRTHYHSIERNLEATNSIIAADVRYVRGLMES